MFERLPAARTDSLMQLGLLMKADPRIDKIDLGVGTYRDEQGRIPIMSAVKSAERTLVQEQASKGYVGPSGDAEFCLRLQDSLFADLPEAVRTRLDQIQAPGGTGALRLALQIVAAANPDAQIWIGVPSWPAHLPLVAAVGLRARTFGHVKPDGEADLEALDAALDQARPGDVVLLHGCCHNPTGADLTEEAWRRVAAASARKGLTPLVDLAYAGLGDSVEDDVAGVRHLLENCENVLVAVSCSKSFGLYRDRTGMLMLLAGTEPTSQNLARTAATHARLLWSNPPDHGAAVVRIILASPGLTRIWSAELAAMRSRVNAIRSRLADIPLNRLDLSVLPRQRGMFALLPLSADEVAQLRQGFGIYMDESGRINVAGLNDRNFEIFAAAIAEIDRVAKAA